MLNTQRKPSRFAVSTIVGVATMAAASTISLASTTVFTITASNGADSASFNVTLDMGTVFGDFFMFNLTTPVSLDFGGTTLGTITAATIQMGGDPFNPGSSDRFIGFSFAVEAGASDTTFNLESTLLTVPTITGALGFATAGITVTDSNFNGASITPLSGSKFYEATYNGGSSFANLIGGPLSATAGLGDNAAEDSASGFTAVGADVDSISIAYRFLLSAGDQASGTSEFIVTPAPAGLAAMGMLGLFASRRRRH